MKMKPQLLKSGDAQTSSAEPVPAEQGVHRSKASRSGRPRGGTVTAKLPHAESEPAMKRVLAGDDQRSNEPLGSIYFLTIAEVAERLGVCSRTVRRWIERGELVAHRVGGVVRIAESDLKAFLERHRGL